MSVKVYYIIIHVNALGFIPTEQWKKSIPQSVERGFWGRHCNITSTPTILLYFSWHLLWSSLEQAPLGFKPCSHLCRCSQSRKKYMLFAWMQRERKARTTPKSTWKVWTDFTGCLYKMLEHRLILEKSCPYCSPVLIPPFISQLLLQHLFLAFEIPSF